ncbi:class I adenylate-forming enzyme family protein [Mesoterricola silvestris]|uniref:Long-chain-fatty-acid--CoA ligase n=1 Tax=Mesoterricola silvestris TaxID=2927979 RepID=A0AA48H158_9BACT|nr:AMP-binding protein [Mesoterricola silvestris]BDU74128.1 long-chain-fatty-acid--CoA ligase [Mesoterricola silvestris]
MLVHQFLSATAARMPHKVALVCGARRVTYAELDAMANRVGHALVEAGVGRGDRVAIHLHNSVEAVAGIFGALKAGGTFVFINASTKLDKLKFILNNCRASALFMDERVVGFQDLWGDVPSLALGVSCFSKRPAAGRVRTFEEIQEAASAAPLPIVNIDLDLACLVYTSGSTGEPKGVMCDHSNVDFASTSIITYLENREEDIVLGVLPLSFDYGLYQLLMTLKFGGTLVLERSFTYPALILQRIQEERITGFPGVPTIFAMLLALDRSSFDLSSLRYLTNTAAALPPSHIADLRAAFPGVTLYSMYGLTETKRTLYLPPAELDARPGSVGIPIPGTEAWLEDESGRRLGPGETGELVVRGRHVMRGYWESPEATARRYRPGAIPGERVCRSGDLFRTDAEGFFYFVGRQDDIIKSRGEKVAPKEVENVLHMLPGVLAAVVGVPDPVAGQVIKACVVCTGAPLTEAEVIAHCRRHLEDFMVPKFVEFMAELPMTSSGKISKLGLA